MKRLFLLPLIAFFAAFTLCANAQNKTVKQVKNNSAEPYQIENKNLSIGNMAYAKKVLLAWKDFENNTVENAAVLFTDDVLFTFADGSAVKGRDNLIKMMKEYRSSLTAVSKTVSACTTLKTPNHPESEAVSIWGMETYTQIDGTVTKTHVNEIWIFNKEGKVYEFHRMEAKDTEDKK